MTIKNPWRWWQATAPHHFPLPCALALQPTSHRDAIMPSLGQSLLGPSLFHNPRTPHVLVSPPEQAAPLSRRGHERQHAVGSHSALALRLYLVAFNPLSSCRFWGLQPSLLQFVLNARHRDSVSLLLNHGNLIFEPVCVSTFPLLPLLFW